MKAINGCLIVIVLILTLETQAMASSGKFYTIQISSVQHERQAKSLIAQLKNKGIDTFEEKIMIKGERHYRICTGYFEDEGMARAARKSIARQTHRKDVFVQKIKTSVLPDKMVIGDFN